MRTGRAAARIAAFLVLVLVAALAGCGDFGEAPDSGPPPGGNGGGGGGGGEGGGGGPAEPDTVVLVASLDNTLYEDPTGSLSNGAGRYFFGGKSLSLAARRGLIRFSVADSLPAGATVDSVHLDLHVSMTRDAVPRTFDLHRVTTRWGEGTSSAGGTGGGAGSGGGGTAATPGDATWTHGVLDTIPWINPGGDFAAIVSGGRTFADTGAYAWAGTPGMVADVQAWVDDPAAEFGWILIGDESLAGTAKRFDSRESDTPGNLPRLTVFYTPPAGGR